MDKNQLKQKFRKFILKSCTHKPNNYKKDKIIVNKLIKYIENKNIKNLMIYIPLKSEVNVLPLIEYFRKKKVNIYVPFMQGKSFILVKYRLPLGIKKFKIKEPGFSRFKIKDIDLAIVPILGIDITNRRVGFGKGMYDRFYANKKIKIKETIFIQRDLYICKEIITQKHDITSNFIATSSIKLINAKDL